MFKKIKPLFKVLEWVVFVVLLGILGLIFSPYLPFKNTPKSFAVVSGSMEPAIHTGSVAFVRTIDPKTIKKGDIIAFTSPSNSKDTILHRVDSIKTTDSLTFSTKGDANNAPDAWDVMDVGVKGVYFGAIPFLGYIVAFVKKPLGFGIVVGIPALLFIISQIFSIKKAINEEVDRKVAKALETKKKTKPTPIDMKSLILSIALFSSLAGLSTLQAIKASFLSTVTVSGISLSVVDFIPPSAPANLRWSDPDTVCGSSTSSYTITAVWDASTPHGSKTIDHYEYESFNPTTGWMWGPVNVSATQRAGAFTVGIGTYGFRVRAIDNLGYASDWTSTDFATSCQIKYSLPTPPAPTLSSPANGSDVNTNGLVMKWDAVTGNYNNPLYYIYQSARNSGFSPVAYTSAYLTDSKIPASGTLDGNYWWHVKTCDALNNCSDWSEAWKVTVDNIAPNVPTVALTVGGVSILTNGYTNSETFTFNLSSCADTTRYQLKYWNNIPVSSYKESTPWNPTNLSGYSSSLGVYNDHFSQGEGIHYFAFSTCDVAGNCSGYSTPFVITYDKTPPVSVITSPVSSNNYQVDVSISSWDGKIEGSASDGLSGVDRVKISIQKDSDEFWSGTDWISGSESSTRVLATGTTNWSYQISGSIPSGFYRIISHAIDKVGNVENSATIEFNNEDSVIPPESIDTSTPTPSASPSSQITLSVDQKYVSFVVNNIGNFKSLSYQLTYDTSTVPQGVIGNTDITGVSYFSGNIPLGMCSTGGICVFSQENKNFQLSVSLIDQNGVTTVIIISL